MGILNDLWWLLGFLMAAPLVIPGAQNILAGNYPWGGVFLGLGLILLLMPEYLRWRLLGGNSVFERVPLLRSRANESE